MTATDVIICSGYFYKPIEYPQTINKIGGIF